MAAWCRRSVAGCDDGRKLRAKNITPESLLLLPPTWPDAMKFKARFSEVGAGWLEKRFLPAFEKLSPSKGVELVLLLTPETVHLIHDAKAQGGAEIHADFVVRTALLTWLLQLRARPFPTSAA
jgi:hypothetical protein